MLPLQTDYCLISTPRAKSASTVAPSRHRCGDETELVTTYATHVGSTTRSTDLTDHCWNQRDASTPSMAYVYWSPHEISPLRFSQTEHHSTISVGPYLRFISLGINLHFQSSYKNSEGRRHVGLPAANTSLRNPLLSLAYDSCLHLRMQRIYGHSACIFSLGLYIAMLYGVSTIKQDL